MVVRSSAQAKKWGRGLKQAAWEKKITALEWSLLANMTHLHLFHPEKKGLPAGNCQQIFPVWTSGEKEVSKAFPMEYAYFL